MKALYIPGFMSKPDQSNPKVQMLEKVLGFDVFIVDTQGEYSVQAYQSGLDDAMRRAEIQISDMFLVVGTSLGGFWARFLGESEVVPWIALNPCLTPHEDLQQFLGCSINGKIWSQNDCSQYESVAMKMGQRAKVRGLVITAKDDPVINPDKAKTLTGCQVEQIETGGHNLINTSDYQVLVKEFVDQSFYGEINLFTEKP